MLNVKVRPRFYAEGPASVTDLHYWAQDQISNAGTNGETMFTNTVNITPGMGIFNKVLNIAGSLCGTNQ